MSLIREKLGANLSRLVLALYCCVLALQATGCGTSSYSAAVDKGKAELERRSKFSALDPEYRRLAVTPYVFQIPKLFVADDEPQKRWIAYGPKLLTPGSRDPHLIKTMGDDARGQIQPGYAFPYEFDVPPFSTEGMVGTLACEYKYTYEDETGRQEGALPLTLTLFATDLSPKRVGPAPIKDEMLLAQLKARGKYADPALKEIRDAYSKAGKTGKWEEERILALPTSDDPQPKDIEAKFLRLPIRSPFLHVVGESRRMVEKNGHLYLWTFRIDTIQFYVAIRVPNEIFAGETPIYAQDLENSENDPIAALGRAMIGTFRVEPSFVQEWEEFKKKGPGKRPAA
jgi:hypothetical protein